MSTFDCPDREYRESLSDGDFWPYVLLGERPGEYVEPDLEPDGIQFTAEFDPCPECGQVSACAFDAEGRPMIHLTESEHA